MLSTGLAHFAVLAILLSPVAVAQGASTEASSAACYRVASKDAEALAGWLARRLEPGSETRIGTRNCVARAHDERQQVTFFDDGNLSLLDSARSLRHVRRSLPDGRPIEDVATATIGSLRFALRAELDPTAPTRLQGNFAFEQLFAQEARKSAAAELAAHSLDATTLRATLRLGVRSVGIVCADAAGTLCSVTLRRVDCNDAELVLQWHELQFEVAPDAAPEDREAARELCESIAAEIAAATPRLLRDLPDDYARSLSRLQQSTWLPVRWLHRFGIDALQAKVGALLLASTLFAAASATLAIRRSRRQTTAAAAVSRR